MSEMKKTIEKYAKHTREGARKVQLLDYATPDSLSEISAEDIIDYHRPSRVETKCYFTVPAGFRGAVYFFDQVAPVEDLLWAVIEKMEWREFTDEERAGKDPWSLFEEATGIDIDPSDIKVQRI